MSEGDKNKYKEELNKYEEELSELTYKVIKETSNHNSNMQLEVQRQLAAQAQAQTGSLQRPLSPRISLVPTIPNPFDLNPFEKRK